jgi:VanZ family protein
MNMVKKNVLSIIIALVIMYLSLLNSKEFENIPTFDFADKLVHSAMYFVFMGVILFENRKTITSGKHFFLAGLIPVFYGVLMEILQGTLTETRTASVLDAVFNTLGVAIAVLVWMNIKPFSRKNVR